MPKRVIWSPKSETDFENILEYLAKNWDASVALKFIDLVDILITQISNNPKQFPLIHKKLNVRKCVISKHNTLYYRNRRKYIELLRIYDNRQNPKSLKFS
jgi:plasmid stabilization system protein ParE